MKNIQTTARWKMHDGKFEEFKKLAEECVEVTKEKSKNTILYDCFFNQDLKECVFS